MELENHHVFTGDIFSNGCFSIEMLVFGGGGKRFKQTRGLLTPSLHPVWAAFPDFVILSACGTGWSRCLNTFGCETISFCWVSGCYVHKTTSFPQTRNIRMRNRPKRQVLVSMAHHFVLHVFWDMSCKSMVLVSVETTSSFLVQIWMSSNQRPYLYVAPLPLPQD